MADIVGDETGQSWNIVPSMDYQSQIVNDLTTQMAAMNLGQPPQAASGDPNEQPKQSGLHKLLFDNNGSSLNKVNNDIVTRAIANQGQLLPIPSKSSSGANDEAMKKLLSVIQAQNPQGSGGSSTPAPTKSSDSDPLGDILSTAAETVASIIAWVICTELARQRKMPMKWYIAGGPVFVQYPEIVKRGYYLWAIPSVRHLRANPNSPYSQFLMRIFLWRAENIAASRGVKGARKLIRGAVVTAILYPLCFCLGAVLMLLGKNQDWMQLYGAKS